MLVINDVSNDNFVYDSGIALNRLQSKFILCNIDNL